MLNGKEVLSLRIKHFTRRVVAGIPVAGTSLLIAAHVAFADQVKIGEGLNLVDTPKIAGVIIKIALGAAGITGAVAVLALLWVGLRKIGDHSRQGREEAKEHLIDIFKGLGIAGLGSLIVAFIAYLIQTATQ